MDGICVQNITKKYKDTTALDHVSLNFEGQKIYGLLGRNGAGKSTLLNVISNRICPEEGQVMIDGEPVWENDQVLRNIYVMSEQTLYPQNMKIKDIFRWSRTFYPNFDLEYALDLAKRFELPVNKTVKSLSTGFSSIFKLIVALSVNVPYLLLDEPVLGLDANNRDLFYRVLLEKYAEDPCTILISTHLIEEISAFIEEVIVIKNGRIICQEEREELLSKGYTVSGPKASVDQYISGREAIGEDVLGGLKTAYLYGKPDPNAAENLEFGPLDLQKLFIKMTTS